MLDLTAKTSATKYFNRPFQALSANLFIRADIAFSALETFCLMGYISLLYLLTYLQNNVNVRMCEYETGAYLHIGIFQ